MVDIIGFLYNNPIILILGLEVGGGMLAILLMFWYNKNRFQVYIVKKYASTFRIVKKMKVTLDSQTFKWKKNFEYKVDFKMAIIDNKGKPVLHYLEDGAEPINIFNSSEIDITADSRTFRVAQDGEILKKSNSRTLDKTMMYIIIGLVIGIILIAIASLYLNSTLNKDILKLAGEVVNATKTNNGGIIPVG